MPFQRAATKPRLRDILHRMRTNNASAAVSIYDRLALGVAGLIGCVLVVAFASPSDKLIGVVALMVFPVLPAAGGVLIDFHDAKTDCLYIWSHRRA